jgi:hypothetical protein
MVMLRDFFIGGLRWFWIVEYFTAPAAEIHVKMGCLSVLGA